MSGTSRHELGKRTIADVCGMCACNGPRMRNEYGLRSVTIDYRLASMHTCTQAEVARFLSFEFNTEPIHFMLLLHISNTIIKLIIIAVFSIKFCSKHTSTHIANKTITILF